MSSYSLPSRAFLSTSEDDSSALGYTAKPLADEVTLEGAYITGPSSGVIERAGGPIVLRLHDQIDGVSSPTIYYKQRISGAALIQPEDCSGATRVSLKIEGTLALEIENGVSQTIQLLDETHALWQTALEGSVSPPALIPLNVELTPDFAGKDGQRRPLPPTCHLSLPAPSCIHVYISYNMTLTVDRRRKHGVLPRSKSLSIPFDYVQRSKPHLPMRIAPLSDAAHWFHETRQIAFQTATTQPLQAKLSIPVAKVYWIGHSIPFHFTLAGPSDALRFLFPEHGAATVSVNMVRQVVAHVRKVVGRREMVLGESTVCRIADGDKDTVLRWEGEVRVSQPETVPAFDAGALLAKDFIVAEITPPAANPAPFDMPPQRIPIFIRLTTDKHEDDP